MKKNIKVFLVVLSFLSISLITAPETQAQAPQAGLQYQLLEKIPGTENVSGSDLPGYVSALYKIALIVVTLSAVLMLSIGGFMYLTSAGNTASMGNAKGIIYDSLIGLVIALAAWLILYIINPDLVKISLKVLPPVTPLTGQAGTPQGLGTLPPESSVELAKQILANGNINLASSGDCKSPSGTVSPRKNIEDVAAGKRMAACYAGPRCAAEGERGCVDDAVRPSETMLKAIWAVGQSYRFTITSMSGGPHGANSAHYKGQAIDISPATQALMDAFTKEGAAAPNGQRASMCENTRGVNVGCAQGSGADHIHLVFPN